MNKMEKQKVAKLIGKQNWGAFTKWMVGQTVGIMDGKDYFYDWDVKRFMNQHGLEAGSKKKIKRVGLDWYFIEMTDANMETFKGKVRRFIDGGKRVHVARSHSICDVENSIRDLKIGNVVLCNYYRTIKKL